MKSEYLVLRYIFNCATIYLGVRKLKDIKIKRAYNSYNLKEYFYEISRYKEKELTNEKIESKLIQRGFLPLEVHDAIIEFNNFIDELKEKELL